MKSLWHMITRRIDVLILWPAIRRQADNLEDAKAAFALHCLHDPGWRCFNRPAILEFIDQLGALK